MKKQLHIVGLAFTAGLFSCKKDAIIPASTPLKTTYTIDFEDVSIPFKGYLDSIKGGLISQGFVFDNESYHYVDSVKKIDRWYWGKGFSVSKIKDETTEGDKNMYASYAGSGSGNSANYLIGMNNGVVKLPSSIQMISIDITNSTYAALSMKNGDQFAKKFTAKDKDFFKLCVKGFNAGKVKDSLEISLADFQNVDESKNYIQKAWKTVDLSKFSSLDSLSFTLKSSDMYDKWINTPGYFALDNIKYTK